MSTSTDHTGGGTGPSGGQTGGGAQTGGDGGQGNGGEPRLFSQEEMNKRATAEKQQGQRAGRASLLEELGGLSVEQIKAAVAAQQAAQDAAKTAEQRATEQAAQAAAAAQAREADLARERQALNIERALLRAGVSPDAEPGKRSPLERALPMVAAELAADADADAITAAVEGLRGDLPALFTAGGGGAGGQGGTGGTGGAPGSDPGRPGTGGAAGGGRPYGSGTNPAPGANGAPQGGGSGGGRTWGAAGRGEAARRRPPAAQTHQQSQQTR